MGNFIVALVGGASLGGTYALISLGLVLVFRATGTFNFAHGQLMFLATLIAAALITSRGVPFGLGVLVSLAIVAAAGVLFYLLVLRRTVGLPHFMGMIATFGLAAALDGAMVIIFGSQQRTLTVPGLPQGTVTLGGAKISSTSLAIAIFTLILAGLIVAVVRYTHVGTVVRAAGQDASLAAQGGIRVRGVYVASWAIAGVLAGIAGILYGSTQVIDSNLESVALAAFPAILLGGIDSIEGALVGGIIIGIIQGFTAMYLNGTYVNLVTYVVLVVVLMVLPAGLFGTKAARQV